MDLSLAQIAFLIIIAIGCFGMSLWIYIDGLKFRLTNAQIDRDMWKNLYNLERDLRLKLDEMRKS